MQMRCDETVEVGPYLANLSLCEGDLLDGITGIGLDGPARVLSSAADGVAPESDVTRQWPHS